jgi:hypothetical protein
VIGGDPRLPVALNPQPLPPRSAFLASVILEITERMTEVCELADLIPVPAVSVEASWSRATSRNSWMTSVAMACVSTGRSHGLRRLVQHQPERPGSRRHGHAISAMRRHCHGSRACRDLCRCAYALLEAGAARLY